MAVPSGEVWHRCPQHPDRNRPKGPCTKQTPTVKRLRTQERAFGVADNRNHTRHSETLRPTSRLLTQDARKGPRPGSSVIRDRAGPTGGDRRHRRVTVLSGSHRPIPDARHVLGRFHLVSWFTEGLSLVRRELQRRHPGYEPLAFEPDLFRARFNLLRRADHLIDALRAHLERLFEAIRGYTPPGTLSNSFTKLYEAEDLDGANLASEGSPTSMT